MSSGVFHARRRREAIGCLQDQFRYAQLAHDHAGLFRDAATKVESLLVGEGHLGGHAGSGGSGEAIAQLPHPDAGDCGHSSGRPLLLCVRLVLETVRIRHSLQLKIAKHRTKRRNPSAPI